MLYKINYTVENQEEFKNSKTYVPIYLLAKNFDDAVNTAKLYEKEGVVLREVKLEFDGNFAISDGVMKQINNKTEVKTNE